MLKPFESPLLIIMGSSKFELNSDLDNDSFEHSAISIQEYFLNNFQSFSIDLTRVLNLFGNPDTPDLQDIHITEFVKSRNADSIIVYYVGHGGFLADRQYCLFLRNTDPNRRHYTALKIRDFAETLRTVAPDKKVILILDCCFSGSAVPEFMNDDVSHIVESQTFAALPKIGTALLVASSKHEPALAPNGSRYTMLAESILTVLKEGIKSGNEHLSIRNVADQTSKLILEKYASYGVRPEIHTPRQMNADISDIPFFPNPGFDPSNNSDSSIIRELVYSSEIEARPFENWVRIGFRSPIGGNQAGIKELKRVYQIAADDASPQGANKYIRLIRGIISFEYMISSYTGDNIIFFVIPMQSGTSGYSYRTPPSQRVRENRDNSSVAADNTHIISPGHRGYTKEYGVESVRDARNGFSPHRVKLIAEDKTAVWIKAEMNFLFKKAIGIDFIAFAPRINEGSRSNGTGNFQIKNVEIFSE